MGQRALRRQLGWGYRYRFLKIIKCSQVIADWLDVSKLIYITFGLSKRCCQSRVIKHFNSMPLNKVSVSKLLSEKSASIFYVTEETSIEQVVSEMNRQRIVSVVVKKSRSICGIFTERGVLTRVLSAGRDLKVTQLCEVMTECIQRNLVYCISV